MQEEKQEAEKRAAQSQAEARQIAQEPAAKAAAEQKVLKALESEKSAALNPATAKTRADEAYEAGQQAMRKAVASE